MIKKGGNRLHGRVTVVPHMKITAHLHMRNLTQQPRIHNILLCFDQVRRAFPLSAHLHDLVIFPGRRHHGFPLHHIHADGLLYIHMGACLYRIDHGKRMPMIGCSDEDDIQLVFRQHFAVVLV
jgi:hypothetical protein